MPNTCSTPECEGETFATTWQHGKAQNHCSSCWLINGPAIYAALNR